MKQKQICATFDSWPWLYQQGLKKGIVVRFETIQQARVFSLKVFEVEKMYDAAPNSYPTLFCSVASATWEMPVCVLPMLFRQKWNKVWNNLSFTCCHRFISGNANSVQHKNNCSSKCHQKLPDDITVICIGIYFLLQSKRLNFAWGSTLINRSFWIKQASGTNWKSVSSICRSTDTFVTKTFPRCIYLPDCSV